jgi:hypothetical protein
MMANWASMSLHCVAIRAALLALDGSTPVDVGSNSMYVSDKLMKLDFNPEYEAGPEVSNRGASGALIQVYKLPDLMKRITISLQMGALDPELEFVLTGGAVLVSAASPLAGPPTLGSSTATTGGILTAATYGYKATALTQYGETAGSTEKTQVVPAGTSTNTVTLTWSAVVGAVGYRIYGRTNTGPWRFIAQVGAAAVSYVDLGTITPDSNRPVPTADTSGVAPNGYSYPAVGEDPTPYGLSLEAWTRNIAEPGTPGYVAGQQVGQAPYIRWVFPRMFLHKGNRTLDMNPADSLFEGYAVENVNWGNGPNNDWLYASDKIVQFAYDTAIPTAAVGRSAIPAQV